MITFRNIVLFLLCGMTAFLAWRVHELEGMAAGAPPVAVMDWGGITNPLNYQPSDGVAPAAAAAAAKAIARGLADSGWLVLDRGAVVYAGSAQVVSVREVKQYLQAHPGIAMAAPAGAGAAAGSGPTDGKQEGGTR